jgi:hypothetical protein
MLYVLNMILVSLWCIYVVKKSKMNWHNIISISIWLNSRELLIYHNWNNLLMALRWFVPFILLSLYDNWERKYKVEC